MSNKVNLKIYQKGNRLIIEDELTGEQIPIKLKSEPIGTTLGEYITIQFKDCTEYYDYLGNRVRIEQ